MFTVYILYSKTRNSYYIGYTTNMARRISEHNRIKGKYTDHEIPWELVYQENFEKKEIAIKRESYLKRRKSKTFIEELIIVNK